MDDNYGLFGKIAVGMVKTTLNVLYGTPVTVDFTKSYNSLQQYFRNFINNIPEELRTENKYVYPLIPEKEESFYDRCFGKEKDEIVLYVSSPDNGKYEFSLFVTTRGIGLYNNGSVKRIYWDQIYRVLYFFENTEGNEEMNFQIYCWNGQYSMMEISEYYLLNSSEKIRRTGWPQRTDRYTCVMETFALLLTNIAKELYVDYREKIYELQDAEKWDEIIQYTDMYLNRKNTIEWPFKYSLHKDRSLAFEVKEDFNRAECECDEAIDGYKETFGEEDIEHDEDYCYMCYRKASLCLVMEKYYEARKWIICASGIENVELKQNVKDGLEEIENSIRENRLVFTNQEYHDRKFVMPVRRYNGCKGSDINVFTMNSLPKDIRFSTGYAKEYELYIGHPYIKDLYIPYRNSEDILFEDKVGELCFLLQALGAVKIEITSIKGKDVEEMFQNQYSVGVNVGYKRFSGQFGYSNEYRSTYSHNEHNQKVWKQEFRPQRSAYIPNGLVWYQNEYNWQRIASQRLNGGGMTGYHFECSTRNITSTSESESTKINASVSYLCVSAGVNYGSSSQYSSREKTETVWSIDVRFC